MITDTLPAMRLRTSLFITATAVLISELAGRLKRTDKINQYLAFPEPAPTIDELIKHKEAEIMEV